MQTEMHTAIGAIADWRGFEPLALDPVLRAAVDVFVERGYHGATVRQIADRAALSVPGIYHYYPTKQDMLVTILEIGMSEVLGRSELAEEEADGDPAVRL